MNRDAKRIFDEFIKATGLKETEQRSLILDAFLNTDEHVSVDDLHHLLDRSGKKVGYATIHRTMKLISESGLAREVMFNDGISRFEHTLDSSPHHHLFCTVCGKIIEFSSKTLDAEEERIAAKHGFTVKSHNFKIFGTCRQCRSSKTSKKRIPDLLYESK